MQQIGIGITTCNRPELLAKCLEQFNIFTIGYDIKWHIHDDTAERKGVAHAKNECLRKLKDCEHIFLFDDDCFPIDGRWIDYFIESKQNHLLYLNQSHRPMMISENVIAYADCGGVFMYLSNEAVNQVGAFDEEYVMWGFEHADYSKRIAMAFNTQYNYYSLAETNKYLYAVDYDLNNNIKGVLSEPEKEFYRQKNRLKFSQSIKKIKIEL